MVHVIELMRCIHLYIIKVVPRRFALCVMIRKGFFYCFRELAKMGVGIPGILLVRIGKIAFANLLRWEWGFLESC